MEAGVSTGAPDPVVAVEEEEPTARVAVGEEKPAARVEEEEPAPKRPRRTARRRTPADETPTPASSSSNQRELSLEAAAKLCNDAQSILVMSGSGISVSSGLATFTAKGGTYDRARKKFKLKQGIDLFHWRFYEERPADSLWFLASMHEAVAKARPTPTHAALVDLEASRRLRRHYTMNIDGLHKMAGATVWNGKDAVLEERTVELHGNLGHLLDVATGEVFKVEPESIRRLKRGKPAFEEEDDTKKKRKKEQPTPLYVSGTRISDAETSPARVRFRVLLYDDEEHEAVLNGKAAMAALEADVATADLVLWLGISFEQSASCGYLSKVENLLSRSQRLGKTPMLLVNPDTDAAFNAASSLTNPELVSVLLATSDCLFAECAKRSSPATTETLPPPITS